VHPRIAWLLTRRNIYWSTDRTTCPQDFNTLISRRQALVSKARQAKQTGPFGISGISRKAVTLRMPIDTSLRAQIETNIAHLETLIGRGRAVRDTLACDPDNRSTMALTRAWQEDCGVTINQLSGGSKSHWLARSFSQAFLMRSPEGQAVEGAPPAEIISRLLGVLEQAIASLSGIENSGNSSGTFSASLEAPAPRRFEFVHNPELRTIVEEAYTDSRRALDEGDYTLALKTSCGILEAIVTDALEHKGLGALAAAPAGNIADWSFNTRLAVAERAGLIRNGCARLPAIARTYRDHADEENSSTPKVSEREARQAGQVLHVVMRDLDPGR